jgi:hypothetical protein
MAINTRTAAPQYKIYEPDQLDVALSQKVLDPLQGGIAGAMLLNHRAETDQNIDRFTADQNRFNNMAAGLDAMEIAQKSKEARMKLAPSMMEHGINAKDIHGIEDLLTPGGIQGNDAATLFGDKTRAEIAAALAKASADRSGSMDTVKETYTDPGTNVTREITHKGKAGRIDVPERAPIDPTASTPIPTAPNVAATQGNALAARAAAAVGASDPKQIQATKDASGNYVIKNSVSGKTATFDPQGKQIR